MGTLAFVHFVTHSLLHLPPYGLSGSMIADPNDPSPVPGGHGGSGPEGPHV